MDTVIDYAKVETLLAMYASLDRMNQAIVRDSQGAYQSEVGLQRNLRSNFEELAQRDWE